MNDPQAYYDEQTGVLMAIFRDEAGKFLKKQFFFSRTVGADDLIGAVTRLEERALPEDSKEDSKP